MLERKRCFAIDVFPYSGSADPKQSEREGYSELGSANAPVIRFPAGVGTLPSPSFHPSQKVNFHPILVQRSAAKLVLQLILIVFYFKSDTYNHFCYDN